MADLKGTRVYWRPSSTAPGAAPLQILKNSGYINVVLQAVQYKANGSFWQRVFGGSDKITVSTQVTWQSTGDPKTAAAIQDFRKVSVPSTNTLAVGRNIVLKVPAAADGIEMQVGITAVHDDNLGRTLQLLNSDEFKQPLQLAPVAVGQILTIANMVKKVFTAAGPEPMLAASYPGIISEGAIDNPVANNRLVQGYTIVVVKQDDEDRLDYDPDQLAVTGNGVLHNGRPIANTFMVYNVSFDRWRGRDVSSSWSKKFDQASTKADDLIFATPDQRQSIIQAAFDLLKEGSALIDDDVNYITAEKTLLKKAAIREVQDKIAANTGVPPAPVAQPRALSAVLEHLGHPESVRGLEFAFEPSGNEVIEYASDLAASGLGFGFSFHTARPAPEAAHTVAEPGGR